jgi:hypothetical protein
MNVCGTTTSREIFKHNYKHAHIYTHTHASFTQMKVEKKRRRNPWVIDRKSRLIGTFDRMIIDAKKKRSTPAGV